MFRISHMAKCKEHGTAANLPREGHQFKLADQARRALIREATKRQMATAEVRGQRICPQDNYQSCTSQIWPLWKSGGKTAVAARKP